MSVTFHIKGRWPGWLAIAALGYLIAINGLATGCNLALDRKR